jgi:glycosyltransferase involved in cell wall biosynthesis
VLFHFGTYNLEVIAPLRQALPGLLRGHDQRTLLLLGRGSERFREQVTLQHPDLAAQVVATGTLPAKDVVEAMAACDAGVYPFPDGVSGRRSSLMAALRLGVPVLTTDGHLTEPLWRTSRAVALAPAPSSAAFVELVESTLRERTELARVGAAGQELYERYFSREHCIERLLA